MSTQRPATFAERCTWGTCPVCNATQGSPCDPTVGRLQWFGLPQQIGAHHARLVQAPIMVRMVLEAVR